MATGAPLGDWANAATVVVGLTAVIQLLLIRGQLESAEQSRRDAVRAERERRTLDACRSFHTDPTLFEIKQRIHQVRLAVKAKSLTPAALKLIERDITNFLNFFESLCIGIEQGVYEDRIVFDNLGGVLIGSVEFFVETHPIYNPSGDLVNRAEYAPLVRIYQDFVDRKLRQSAPNTYSNANTRNTRSWLWWLLGIRRRQPERRK